MRPELGTKRDCPNCDAKFYDLNRDPAACPKCGYTFAPEMTSPRAKAARPAKEEAVASPAKAAPAPVVVSPLGDDDDEESLAVDDDTEVSLEGLEDEEVDDGDGDGDGEEDTFLEEDDEEEGSDVTELIGGHPAEDEDT